MSPDPVSVPRLVARARSIVFDHNRTVDFGQLAGSSCLECDASALSGKNVLVATRTQLDAGLAFVELDGLAHRMLVAPPDLKPDHVQDLIQDAAIDAVVTDAAPLVAVGTNLEIVTIGPLRPRVVPRPLPSLDTEWVLLTSGTSGRPKMAVHSLAGLVGAFAGIDDPSKTTWATFYDIRRYGGLQIFLRAIFGGADLVLKSDDETIADHLSRLGAHGVEAMSGTPSHWRRVLMSQARNAFAPHYIRLSGEIADQMVLDGLRKAFPAAAIAHAYASTEAGVGFAVDDGLEGFPASLVETPPDGVEMKVVDGTLRIRSHRAASRYLGRAVAPLADADGFVDTGDLVELRDDRYRFVGRRGGIINVGGLKVNPEEVEAALNSHQAVRMSLVSARRNPLTGAIVVADVVLHDTARSHDEVRSEILDACRTRLERHKVPAILRFVGSLPLTSGGKLARRGGGDA